MDNDDELQNSTSLSQDIDRLEMKWTDNIEDKLEEWSSYCNITSKKHMKASKIKKSIFYILSIPAILVPLIMSFTNQFYGDDHVYSKYINSFGYLIVGTLTGVNTFLNYGGKYIEHEVASNRYNEITLEIESILIKKKKYRTPADVVIEHIKSKIECLNKFSITI